MSEMNRKEVRRPKSKRAKAIAAGNRAVSKDEEPSSTAPPRKTITINLEESLKGAMRAIGGSKCDGWNEIIASQALNTLWKTGNEGLDSERADGILTGLICMKPRDEFEGMLVAQMVAVQNAAMECYKRAMVPGQVFDWHQESLNQANKLSRTFTTLLEALNRHRGKGQQKVIVEHVHVHAGGQAVVGVVEAQGGGGLKKLEDQPHAVRSQDPEREALPVPRNA